MSHEFYLEVDGRRRVPGLYSDDAGLHLGRGTEVVLANVHQMINPAEKCFILSHTCFLPYTILDHEIATHLDSNCVLIDSLQYNLSPGLATRRSANSRWNISTAHLQKLQRSRKRCYDKHQYRDLPEKWSMQEELEYEWR